MDVDETPRATGRFNLDQIAQEQMSEELETWTPPEPTPSLRDHELSQARLLAVDVVLTGLTPSSTGGTQGSQGASRLKELQERLQSRTAESPASEGEQQPVVGGIISKYKKDINGRYHRHANGDWTSAQWRKKAAFNEATCVEYLAKTKNS